jgi:hypothetical protein
MKMAVFWDVTPYRLVDINQSEKVIVCPTFPPVAYSSP